MALASIDFDVEMEHVEEFIDGATEYELVKILKYIRDNKKYSNVVKIISPRQSITLECVNILDEFKAKLLLEIFNKCSLSEIEEIYKKF